MHRRKTGFETGDLADNEDEPSHAAHTQAAAPCCSRYLRHAAASAKIAKRHLRRVPTYSFSRFASAATEQPLAGAVDQMRFIGKISRLACAKARRLSRCLCPRSF